MAACYQLHTTKARPEFAELSKRHNHLDGRSDRPVPDRPGTISMYIYGKIRNKGTRTIDVLEINVAVITQFNQVVKKNGYWSCRLTADARPRPDIPVTLAMEGFSKDDDRANIGGRLRR